MQLYNIYDKETLMKRLLTEDFKRVTISFYRYANIQDPQEFRNELFKTWTDMGILGRTYVAHEGINAQISVPEPSLDLFKSYLNTFPFLQNLRLNYAIDDDGKSFLKLAIKVRDKIVADGIDDPNFDPTNCGTHLNAKEFNELLEKEGTVVVDMRNHYESEVGHFEGAILPDVDTFRDQLPLVAEMLEENKDKTILMYCTGGIRCEKASAYMKYKGYKNVYQLEGGIIEYARQAKNQNLPSKFIGKNFVFDDRLGERITDDIISNCHQCGKPCDTHTNCANDACHLLFIQCEECAQKHEGCCSKDCLDFMYLPKEEQIKLRKGKDLGQNIYRKGRIRPKIKPISE